MDVKCLTFPDDSGLLFEEMSHRFSNSLQLASSMIELMSRAVKRNENYILVAAQLQQRIIILADLHRKLASPIDANADLSSTCQGVCLDLIRAFGRDDARLSFDLQMMTVCPRIARTIILILAELITNAAKHGRTENALRISVALRFNGEMCAMRVCSADTEADENPAVIERTTSPRVAARLAQAMGGLIEARRGPWFQVDVLLPAYAEGCGGQADRSKE